MMYNAAFFKAARQICGSLSQTQVDSINGILRDAHEQNVTDPDMLGYMLSTGWNECRLKPVREGFKKTDASARAYVKKHYASKYGKPAGPYGHWYYGRGLVQLTWWSNYKKLSKMIGVDLEKKPDRAMEPAIAAKILVKGMLTGAFNGSGKGLAAYLGNGKTDWKNARRTVNVTDKWTRFRDTAKKFSKAIKQHGYKPTPVNINVPESTGAGAGGVLVTVGTGLAVAWQNGLWALLAAMGLGIIALVAWKVWRKRK